MTILDYAQMSPTRQRGERIRRLRVAAKMSQDELAALMGIKSKGAISQWESGISCPKRMERLADILKTNTVYLETGEGDPGALNSISAMGEQPVFMSRDLKTRRVPLLSDAQAGDWREIDAGTWDAWAYTTADVSSKAFAIIMSGDSMSNAENNRSIPEGAVLFVDPEFNEEQLNKRIVVATMRGNTEITVKEYVKDGPVKLLKSFNRLYPVIPFTDEYCVIGVVKQVVINL